MVMAARVAGRVQHANGTNARSAARPRNGAKQWNAGLILHDASGPPPNRLLQMLHAADFDLLRPHPIEIELVRETVLGESGRGATPGSPALTPALIRKIHSICNVRNCQLIPLVTRWN
jgi:hypothetical protein